MVELHLQSVSAKGSSGRRMLKKDGKMCGAIAVLVRHATTGMFLAPDGRWTPGFRDAISFESATKAVQHVKAAGLENTATVLWKGEAPGNDLVLWAPGRK
jgi:hypothetical protein